MFLLFFLLGLAGLASCDATPNWWDKIDIVGNTPSARLGSTAQVRKNELMVVFGGAGDRAYNDMWGLDLVNHSVTWNKIYPAVGSDVPAPRVFHTCTVTDSTHTMFCFGGQSSLASPTFFNDFWVFDFDTRKWDHLDTPPISPRSGHVAAPDCLEKTLFIFGGRDATKIYNDFYMYSIPDKIWYTIDTAVHPSPRIYSTMVSTHCEILAANDADIYLHGGETKINGPALMDVWHFEMKKAKLRSWTEVTYRPDNVPLRYGHMGFDVGNLMMVWGGSISDFSVWYFNEDRHQWYWREPLGPRHPPQLRHFAYDITGTDIYVFGGVELNVPSLTPVLSSDLWAYHIDPCKFHSDCQTCQNDATCGWCLTKQACISGDAGKGKPVWEICPLFIMGSMCPKPCDTYTNCYDCASDMRCGWCTETPAYPKDATMCIEGTSDAPLFDECTGDWMKSEESCPTCPSDTDCDRCLARPDCGFCIDTKICAEGNPVGPKNASQLCETWLYGNASSTMCNPTPPPNCGTYKNCGTCIIENRCGWCSDYSAPGFGLCIEGSPAGPHVDGACAAPNYYFYTCPPPPPLGAGWVVFIIIAILGLIGGAFAFFFLYWRKRAGGFERIQ